jgi:hypothetical protein
LRPLVETIGATNLQSFVFGLVEAPAQHQLAFLVDFAAVLFPPLMALKAGHLTARFAAERAEQAQGMKAQFELDLNEWRQAWNDPLLTEEGQELLKEYIDQKLVAKQAREATRRSQTEKANSPFGKAVHIEDVDASIHPMLPVNEHGIDGNIQNGNGFDRP